MYYRRKILLSLLNVLGGNIDKIKLQKLLFLFTQEQLTPTFHFVPYKFGCFSFQANADLNTMIKYEQVSEDNNSWMLLTEHNYIKELKNEDRIILSKVKSKFASYNSNELIKYTYVNYPFYATKSTIARDRLSDEEYEKVLQVIPTSEEVVLYTIGYEGISLEEYLQKLLKNDIKVLLDVRNFPRSMKYGFSKNQLKNACEGLDIEYIHLPNLGIVSDKRKDLNSQKDYDLLFEDYKKTVLTENEKDQLYILDLIKKHDRVALTCFEKNTKQCHRTHLAKSIAKLHDWDYSIKHI